MKKIVGIIAAAALAASAFAEINIGSWSRGAFVPVATDGDGNVNAFEGANWDNSGLPDDNGYAYGVRTGLGFSASSENAGVVFDIHGNTGASIAIGDNAYTWVKPVDMLTLKFGKIDNNWGRLDHCFGTWDYDRFSIERGEGLAGVGRQNGLGGEITLQPVEGLVIDYEFNFWGDTNHTYDVMWESSSTMIGYQADFGFIRAIINGQPAAYYKTTDEDTKPAAVIALAADITAIENLVLKAGFSIPTNLTGYSLAETTEYDKSDWEIKDDGTIGLKDSAVGTSSYKVSSYPAIKAAVAADYNLDAFAFHAQVNLDVLPKKLNSDGDAVELGAMGFNIGAGVDYAFNDVWKLVTDFRFQSYTSTNFNDPDEFKYEDPAFGAYLGLQQQLTNASFAFGAMFGKRAMHDPADADDFTFAVPLTMTVSF